MPASPATFPVDSGPLELSTWRRESAWKLEWGFWCCRATALTPGVYEVKQLVALHHWQDAAPN